jgi:sec-independent protein translocase protein TatC
MARLRLPFRRRKKARLRAVDDRMTLVEHLAELRERLVKALFAVAVGAIGVFVLYDPVQRFLIRPYQDTCARHPDWNCTTGFLLTDPLEGFATRTRVAAILGLVLALPVVLWQIWRFITPGLHPHEKRYAVPFVACSLVLFGCGATIAWLTWPKALEFLIGFSGGEISAGFTPSKYVNIVLLMVVAFGAAFQFPVLLTFLQLAGVMTFRQLASARRYAIVIIVVVAAVITPSGDPISLFAMAVPMYLFYEISIVIGWLVSRRRTRAGAAAAS